MDEIDDKTGGKFMELSPYNPTAIFYNALKLKNAKILEEDETGIMIQIHDSQTALVLQSNLETAKIWFDKHPPCSFDLISLYGDALCDLFYRIYVMQKNCGQNEEKESGELDRLEPRDKADLINKRDHYANQSDLMSQKTTMLFSKSKLFVWPENQKAEFGDFSLIFKTAGLSDYSWIRSHYDLVSNEELKEDLEDGRLFIGYWNGQPVGFAGIHPEGSMGLLEILPKYRKQGFGKQMEEYLIQQLVEHHLAACCEVFCDNFVSIALQKKMGLKEVSENCYWIELESES